MKKLALFLSLILCLALMFAFASCGKKPPAATTGEETQATPTGAATTAADTTGTEPTAHVHTPNEEYTVDKPATCTVPGSKSKHCSSCGEAIESTVEEIPATGHTPAAEFTVDEPATCTVPGSKSKHCTVCSAIIESTVEAIPAPGHTVATEYTVDVPATCSTTGTKSYHCTVCNAIIENTSENIPTDANAHVPAWADEKIPTLLDESGYRDGECSLCHVPLHEDLTWEPEIFDSKNPSGKYYDEATGNYSVRETFGNIRGDQHFFPTSEENPLGNDVWFEYSLLWNETLANALNARISVAEVTGYDEPDGCELFGLNTRDVAANEEYAGRFCFNRTYVYGSKAVDKKEGTDWSSSLATPSDCVLALGNGQPRYLGRFDETVTADSYVSIGNYGWHRIGFRYHIEADPSDPENTKALAEPGQKGSYYAYTELYVDGVKVWKIEESIVGYWDGNAWQNRSFALRPNDAVPFKLTASEAFATSNAAFVDKAIEFNGIWYVDNDKRSVGMTFYGVANSENAVYIVIDDPQWTCGDGFVRNVEPVADPAAKDFTLADGVTVPGAIYFQEVEVHVHTQATEYTVDAPATCSADGSMSYHCIVCGDSIPGTSVVIPADPTLHNEVIEVKTPNLLDPDGYRRGECTICHQTVTNEVLTWEPVIFDSKNPSGDYYDSASGDYAVRKTFGEIRGSKHFYPTEADHDGNDLWFEYSLLWNETLANTANARISAVDIVGYDPCEIYGLNTRDVAADEEFAGRFCFNRTYVYGSGAVDKKEGTEWTSKLDPASDCVLALGNGQPRYLGRFDETVTADSFAPIGNYGWHRIGFRLHMEADPNDPDNAKALAEPGQKGSYYAYTELYVDGVKVWKVEESIVGFWDGDSWENRSFALRPNDALPFILTADQTVATTKSAFKNKSTEYDGIWYVDKDNRSVGLCFAGVAGSENAVYIVIDDVQWTCGDGFVRNVEPVADPVAKTLTLAEGVTVPAAVYFKLAD